MRRCIGLRICGGWRGCDVTDFRRSCSGISGGCGVCVHVSYRGAAELVGDGLQNFTSRGIFDGAHSAADVNGIANTHADFISDVDDDDVSADVGNQDRNKWL